MSIVQVSAASGFEAAHFLPCVPEGHKCGRVHGHSYRVSVTVESEVGPDGMVIDFATVDCAQQELVIAKLDHRTLNDIEGLENPTAENLAIWIAERLKPRLPDLKLVVVEETSRHLVSYEVPR